MDDTEKTNPQNIAGPHEVPSDKQHLTNQDELLPESSCLDPNRIVKHIMVIGFHHKHGYQVDYCYPPLTPNGSTFSTLSKPITLPDCWKTLPLLCLPDGSHNYDSDIIYFTMPDVQESTQLSANKPHLSDENSQNLEQNIPNQSTDGIKTIFGTACYRQIQADKLLNRTDDMTRIAVQKSVCILCTKPLFGLIRSKLELITHAYFEELDFSKVNILRLTYENLNSLLARDSIKEKATFLGLSARNLISQFGYNTLVLFKAMLLEKRILFYKSPVKDLCSTILTMCSLFTGLLECGGLDFSTCDLQLSSQMLEALGLLPQPTLDDIAACDETKPPMREDKVFFSPSKEEVVIISDTKSNNPEHDNRDEQSNSDPQNKSTNLEQTQSMETTGQSSGFEVINKDDSDEETLSTELADSSVIIDQYALKLCKLKPEECGLPLQIFTRGSFCLPYLSITYLDLLADSRIKGFVIGATNFLFKQKRDMYDIVVDMEENSIVINDINLKKCLTLTTEDLRFMDNLSKHVKLDPNQSRDGSDLISQDITKWVGGDEWIRYNFTLYTLYLLKASKSLSGWDPFNKLFVQAWRQTSNNYKIWDATGKSQVLDALESRHPSSCSSKGFHLSDMRLKLSYAVNSSEKGRIINQTLNGIGKWNIWNNIASAAAAATSSAAATITSASNQIVTNTRMSNHSKSDEPQSTSSSGDTDNII